MSDFKKTFSYKLIYVFRINDDAHKGLLKIGDATIDTDLPVSQLTPSCRELNQAAKERINSYTRTASVAYELLYTELAIRNVTKKGVTKTEAFRDKKVHNVLTRSGIKKHEFHIENEGVEWFKTDLETAKNAISAVKSNRSSLDPSDISEDNSPIIFRPEQKEAIKATVKQFKVSDRMLWNAKMRFGKTLTALEVAKEMQFNRTLIFTHRPVVSDGWFEDFAKIFKGTNYKFGSKTQGERIENLVDGDEPFVYFASIQDLRGSSAVGGKFDKNEFIFLIDWDYVIVDEAHEGTQTTLGQKVLEAIVGNEKKTPKLLELSGTPFNLLADFKEGEIYTWDYIMEQKAKRDWPLAHFGDSNPYEELPQLEIFTYNLEKYITGYVDDDSAFNFKEFFRTWTGSVQKDYKVMPSDARIGDFVHKNDVWAFLNLLTKRDDKTNYPFSKDEYRNYYRHTLWMVPGVKEAKALSKMLKSHPVFSQFNIVNVAGEGDEETDYANALSGVRHAIGNYPDETYSITISCGRLTTGVTVPEWTAVFMLAGSFSTSASSYLQTIFRVQTPANINGRMKERCSVFDFAPDRALKMAAEAGHLSSKTGKLSDKVIMGEFLNFCPVVSVDGSNMKAYNVDGLLQQLKKAYTDRVVKNGFDDRHIYNENLLKLNDIELQDFEDLKKIVGASKQTEAVKKIDVNNQGFTDEEYEELERIERKPKKELTPEEIAFLEEKKKKRDNAQKAMSILRGISIRIPLLIYGADVPDNEEITVDNFVDKIDDSSWNEFMPTGVTKDVYKKFAKYYEEDVFVAAGRQIRNMAKMADDLSPIERVVKISQQFSMFKNPDKETVLTPWRVVNMHIGNTLGGYCFYDEKYENMIDEPRFIDLGKATKDTLINTNAKILEINSKTGLYPLYATYSIYRAKLNRIPKDQQTLEKQIEIWNDTVQNNIYVICKTPMAKSITKRTLLGYRRGKINAHAFDDLITQLKDKPQQFREKISRGNFWNKEIDKMEFDAIIGNPPYQLNDGGGIGDSATPIYQLFISQGKKLDTKYLSMIVPSRWMKGGKGLSSFRDEMMQDYSLSKLYDYADARECFPNIHIDGGICYFLWDKNYNGEVDYFYKDLTGMVSHSKRYLKTEFSDTIIRDVRQVSIIRNVAEKKETKFSTIVSTRNPYGLYADLFNSPDKYKDITWYDNENANSIKVFGVKGIKGGAKRVIGYINKDSVSKSNGLDKYKLLFGKAYMTTSTTPPDIIIAKPNDVCTETFLQIGPFDTELEAKNCLKYIHTKFFRALLFFNRSSLNISTETFNLIPMQNFTSKSDIDWSMNVVDIDKYLYKKYKYSENEISFIEELIKPM